MNSGSTLVDAAEFTVNHTLTNNGTIQRTQDVNGSSAVSFFDTGGYGGGTLNANGTNLGSTTVKIRGNQDCTTTAGETVKRCFDIAPTNTSGRNATITFLYNSSELSGNNCNTMNAYHRTGSAWQLLTLDPSWGDDGRVCEAEPPSMRVTGVTDFSPFVLKSGDPPGGGSTSGTITIVKDTVPNGPQGFNFSGDLGDFSLDDDTDPLLPHSQSFTQSPGTYDVTEDDPTPAFDLVAITCDDTSSITPSIGYVVTRTVTINLEAGETVTCTFTNRQRGTIVVEKVKSSLAPSPMSWIPTVMASPTPRITARRLPTPARKTSMEMG